LPSIIIHFISPEGLVMKPSKYIIAFGVCVVMSSAHSLGVVNSVEALKDITIKGGKGQFSCAYKGKQTKNPCIISVKKELVNHPDFVAWYGKEAEVNVIKIEWPDGDISRYTWSDSGEMLNLTEKSAGGYQLAGDEVTQDWSRGLVIMKNGSEYIRIW
jgi:hypothetical protein